MVRQEVMRFSEAIPWDLQGALPDYSVRREIPKE